MVVRGLIRFIDKFSMLIIGIRCFYFVFSEFFLGESFWEVGAEVGLGSYCGLFLLRFI